MADIELYEDDSEDTVEPDENGSDIGFEDYDPDAGLTMLQRLDKYSHDENMYTRQMVTRSLLETIRTIENDDQAKLFFQSIEVLADDPEAMVRAELMEHVPHIAIFCLESQHIFGDPIPSHLLPIVVKYITDNNNQVRKTSQAALLVLLEQEMIKRDEVEKQVCPIILELAHPESIDDFRTEAVALMSKLAPLIGKEASERLFLERFAEMCTDALFHVRKVCATNFGDFCQVVGQENTESILLQKFFYLCEDGVWGVRKACAECFMQVSCVCSSDIRRRELAQLFVNLICDQSRWVRMAAFQALGGFISTFADPSHTGLYFNDEGMLMVGNPDDFFKPHDEMTDDTPCDNQHCDRLHESGPLVKAVSESNPSQQDLPGSSRKFSDQEAEPSSESAMETDDLETSIAAIQQLHLEPSVEEIRAKQGLPCTDSSKYETATEALSDGAINDNISLPDPPPSAQSIKTLPQADGASAKKVHIHMDNTNVAFNTFQYWRMPLPEINVDVNIVDGKAANIHIEAKVMDSDTATALVSQFDVNVDESLGTPITTGTLSTEALEPDISMVADSADSTNNNTTKNSTIHTANVSTVCETVEEVANIGSTHILGHQVNESTMSIISDSVQSRSRPNLGANASLFPADGSLNEDNGCLMEIDQDVIPQALLDHYLSMIDPSRAQTVDSEIAKHCAYSLPAVAYTLGRRYWPCLKELFETLASDMQWKVRRTLAFSIHELAVILGEDITTRDLVPIFNGFLKDLDEVRIGVLKHLGDFLRLLTAEARQEYLTKIYEFLNTDNTRNWRFREELAQQLRDLTELYSPSDITEHLVPVAFTLTEDGVAAVRLCAFSVLSGMIARLCQAGDDESLSSLVNDIRERFGHSPRWGHRQMYVNICQQLLEESAMPLDQFATDFLPSMLTLAGDPIPNVRISLSRALAKFVINSDFFTSAQNPSHSELLQTIQTLKSDTDRDVRHFLMDMSDSTDLGHDMIPV